MALYAQTSGAHTTDSATFTPIPGLSVTVPGGVDTSALVIANLPNPYATGNNFPGGNIGVSIDGAVSPVFASFTYNEQVPPSTGRIPTTLVVGVPLIMEKQVVQAVWCGVRGSTVHIDSPSTLSVVFS